MKVWGKKEGEGEGRPGHARHEPKEHQNVIKQLRVEPASHSPVRTYITPIYFKGAVTPALPGGGGRLILAPPSWLFSHPQLPRR